MQPRVMSLNTKNNNLLIQPYNRCVAYYYRFIRYEPYRWLKMYTKMIYMISWMMFFFYIFFYMIIKLLHWQYVTGESVIVYTNPWENGSQFGQNGLHPNGLVLWLVRGCKAERNKVGLEVNCQTCPNSWISTVDGNIWSKRLLVKWR